MSTVTTGCPFCDTLNRVDLGRLGHGPRCAGCGRPLLLDRPQPIPGEALDRIIADAEVPFLLDFYADWCGCSGLRPPAFRADAGAQGRIRVRGLP